MNLLLTKLTVAPLLVMAASMAGRRWGQMAAGLVAGFPIVAGPILFFFALEQGPEYAAAASQATLLGLISLSFFAVAFSWRAYFGGNALSCVLLGWLGFAIGTALINGLNAPSLTKCFLWAIGALFLARTSLPKFKETPELAEPSRWDLPLRGLSAAALVLTLTYFAEALGPRIGGFLTPFPVASTVLAVFAVLQGGGAAGAAVLKGLLLALNSFAVFCLVLCLALPKLSIPLSFVAAASASVAMQAIAFKLTRKR